MATRIEGIKASLTKIARGETLLDMLLEFERTLDQTEIYTYLNWELGEIVDGPHVTRCWFMVSLMYPKSKMPDPRGGLRLEKLGCTVSMIEDIFLKPERVLEPEDVADTMTKKAHMSEIPVWIVTIKMPLKYIDAAAVDLEEYISNEVSMETERLSGDYSGGRK